MNSEWRTNGYLTFNIESENLTSSPWYAGTLGCYSNKNCSYTWVSLMALAILTRFITVQLSTKARLPHTS